jgi:signal transduction histidine kinase
MERKMMRDPELESYSRMVLKLRATEQENRQLRTQIVAIRREEQLRIARDLHDKVAGQAASLHYFIAAAANDSQDIAPAVALSRSVLEQLRNSVSDIRDEEASTFAAELDRLRLLYPQLRLGVEGELPTELDQSLITVLICCIQECMTNELKHSHGNELSLHSTVMSSRCLLLSAAWCH